MDSPNLTVWIFVALILLMAFQAVRSGRRQRAKERSDREQVIAWATAHGWTYRDGGGGSWTAVLKQGQFRHGVKFQLEGMRHGHRVVVAHWCFQTQHTSSLNNDFGSSGDYILNHNQMVIALRLPADYPELHVETRDPVSRQLRSWGWKGDLARLQEWNDCSNSFSIGHTVFDEAFRLRSADPAAARQLLTRQLVEAHLTRRIRSRSAGEHNLAAPRLRDLYRNGILNWSISGHDLAASWSFGAHPHIELARIFNHIDKLLAVAALLPSPPSND
ncbi:hypothetical protein [Streptomyces sp. YIM S03343]